jgi:hypothetical protein
MKGRLAVVFAVTVVAAFFFFGTEHSSANNNKLKNVTFSKDVAKILNDNCVVCHRANDIAPFSLTSYKETRPWARSIKEKVLSREMPPWHADPAHGQFSNDRRLSQQEIDTIVAWVDGGAKEGNPKDLPTPPQFNGKWRVGQPDIVLTMPKEYTLAAEGPDEYINVEIPTNFKEDVWVRAVEAVPGNRKIVHHIIAFVQPPQPDMSNSAFKPTKEMMDNMMKNLIFFQDGLVQRTKLDAPVVDNGCGSPLGGSGILLGDKGQENTFIQMLGGEAPGSDAITWPIGTAKKIPAGSKIILQMHYSRNGKLEKDQSSVGLYLAKNGVEQEMHTQMVLNYHFQIPPGAENHEVTACYTFKENVHIFSVAPHMHLRGKDMKITAFYPDGKSEVLVDVPHYSFNWQTNYVLQTPKALPKGTRIEVVAHYDNSKKNKYNPDPTKPVRFGEPTYDEMMIGFVDFTNDAQHLNNRPAAAGKMATGSK